VSLTTVLVMVTAVYHVYLVSRERHGGAKYAVRHAVGSVVVACLCAVVIWPLSGLTGYHVRLLLLNITTIEQVRDQAHRKLTRAAPSPNPFSIGRWYHNFALQLFRPPGYDWVDLSGIAMHDTRKINPGFVVRAGRRSGSGSGDDWR